MKHTTKKEGLALKGRMHRSDLAILLEGMLKDLNKGNIRIHEGAENATLALPDDLEFEIRSDNGKGSQKLLIELKWDCEAEQFHRQECSSHSPAKAAPGADIPCPSPSGGAAFNALVNAKEAVLTNEERLFFRSEENMFFTPPRSTRKDLLGQDVYNLANERVGTVEDLILTSDKVVSSAVIGTGEDLGWMRRDLIIPVDQLKVKKSRLILSETPTGIG